MEAAAVVVEVEVSGPTVYLASALNGNKRKLT
jgi:hypothetical protein